MAAKIWTPAKNRKLLRMYHSGKFSTSEMAERLHVSQPTVYNHLRRLGVSTTSLPRRYRAAIKHSFTNRELSIVREMKEQGAFATEIALRLGKTIGPVRRIISEQGFTNSNFKPIPSGTRFGAAVVLSASRPVLNTNTGYKAARSTAQCDCGKKFVCFNHVLRSGNTTSCGCRFNRKNPDHKYVRYLHQIVSGARMRGAPQKLTLSDIKVISLLTCAYCGNSPDNVMKGRNLGRSDGKEVLRYMGIDQVEPGAGYILGNIVPCCRVCNRAKSNLQLREFITWLGRHGSRVTEKQIWRAAQSLKRTLDRTK